MKRPFLGGVDPGDRAMKLRRQGMERIQLDQIGFYPDNRGGMGISPHHVHEVAHDCIANGVKLSRYNAVQVVILPREKLPGVLARNKQACEDSPLMPSFSNSIKYATVTNTHFVHAQKLAKEGRHTLHGEKKYLSVGLTPTQKET